MANAILRTKGVLTHKIFGELYATYTVVVVVVATKGRDIGVDNSK